MTTNQTIPPDDADQTTVLAANQALEAMLRADASDLRATYIHNDGFSDAVMQRVALLPPPAPARAFSSFATPRLLIVSTAAAIATAIALVGSGGGDILIDAVMDLATFTITPSVLAIGGMLLVACTAAIATVATER